MRQIGVRIVALALTLVVLAACGGGDEVVTSDDPRPSTTSPLASATPGQRYTAKATDAGMQAAIEHARSQPDVGGVWVDQSINPASREAQPDETATNDPTRLVLNVTFTGDLERHEDELRARWGGALCVSGAAASMADLEVIRREVEEEVGRRMTYSSIDEVTGRIEVGVYADDGLQARFDERYGEGVVLVGPMLRPVGG